MNILDKNWLEYLLLILAFLEGLIFINMVAGRHFARFDLTQEHRYSISHPTKQMLQGLDDNIYIEVYLDGDLPAGFKRMRKSLLETLDEFRIYSNNKVQFKSINPELATSAKSRSQLMKRLASKGLPPTDVFVIENGKKIQKRILPGVVVVYGSRELGVQLFKGNQSAPANERINQSIEGMEYELANAIHSITQSQLPVISLARGNDELKGNDFSSLLHTLQDQFRVKTVNLKDRAIGTTDLLLVAQPKSKFSELEKYRLDQYIIRGGAVIFLIDKLSVSMDSAATGTYSFPYDLNLDDLLFHYGVRINNDLVQDFVSGAYPIVVGNAGDRPNIQLLQWPFFPIINDFSSHVIVKNLDALRTEFVSSIDTVKAEGIRKEVLFTTSNYARRSTAPVHVDINSMKDKLDPKRFQVHHIPIACLLEGRFSSFFKNRFLPDGADTTSFKTTGMPAKLLVVGDGDIARNLKDPKTGAPLPLGYDPYLRQMFSNQDFILNSLNYLIQGEGLIKARAKEVKIRPLDKVKIQNNRRIIQFINLALPVLGLLMFGLVFHLIRKFRYSKF